MQSKILPFVKALKVWPLKGHSPEKFPNFAKEARRPHISPSPAVGGHEERTQDNDKPQR